MFKIFFGLVIISATTVLMLSSCDENRRNPYTGAAGMDRCDGITLLNTSTRKEVCDPETGAITCIFPGACAGYMVSTSGTDVTDPETGELTCQLSGRCANYIADKIEDGNIVD